MIKPESKLYSLKDKILDRKFLLNEISLPIPSILDFYYAPLLDLIIYNTVWDKLPFPSWED
jgi:hypothetical protein